MMSLHAAAGSLPPILHSSGLSQGWLILCLDFTVNVLFDNVDIFFCSCLSLRDQHHELHHNNNQVSHEMVKC